MLEIADDADMDAPDAENLTSEHQMLTPTAKKILDKIAQSSATATETNYLPVGVKRNLVFDDESKNATVSSVHVSEKDSTIPKTPSQKNKDKLKLS